MQMRKILILSAIDDEAICLEVEFFDQALHCGVQVCQESGVLRIKICQRLDLSLRNKEQMNLIAWRRMLKRNQVRRLAEAGDWEEKTHMGEYPTDEEGKEAEAENFPKHGFLRITNYVIRDA